jgi:multicomponent Na+:H+ antiporter subunit E
MPVLLIIVLALGWTAISGNFSFSNLLLGLIAGGLAFWLLRERLATPKFLRRTWRILGLLGLFLFELFMSAISVALLVAAPRLDRRLKPAIVAFPLKVTRDFEITLLANMITLTPGTLSIDVSDDRKTLYIHAISVPNKNRLISDIARGFEHRIIEAFK